MVAASSLNAANVVFGLGTDKIVFNHNDMSYNFTLSISGAGSVAVYSDTTQSNTNHTYSGDGDVTLIWLKYDLATSPS